MAIKNKFVQAILLLLMFPATGVVAYLGTLGVATLRRGNPCDGGFQSWALQLGIPVLLPVTFLLLGLIWMRPLRKALTATLAFSLSVWVVWAIAVPSGIGAAQRERQKQTLTQMSWVASALEAHRLERGEYPRTANLEQLAIPSDSASGIQDAWGTTLGFQSDGQEYILVSFGQCGTPDVEELDQYETSKTTDPHQDIVIQNGRFLRYPEGYQP